MTNLSSKVSIVLPTYNGSKYIRQSIDSCLNQTYEDLELIIVDDCSIDDTPDIIKSYRDPRIKYIRHPDNRKLPAALNSGFANSTGDYLTWTSDDNYFASTAIAEMVRSLNQNEVDFVYSDYYTVCENGEKRIHVNGQPSDLLIYSSIGACFLYTRSMYEAVGEFREDLFLCEDYEYWLRGYAMGFKFYKISTPLYFYRKHKNNLSSKQYFLIREKTDQIRKYYVMKSNSLSRKDKGELFLAIAKKTYYEDYPRITFFNLLNAAYCNPLIFITGLGFVKIIVKLIMGEKFASAFLKLCQKLA